MGLEVECTLQKGRGGKPEVDEIYIVILGGRGVEESRKAEMQISGTKVKGING
jgi:hypothetical protein